MKKSYTNSQGYKKVYRPSHAKSNSNGYVSEHTLAAQQKYRREVRPNEVVHHKDGNKQNNHWGNLQIMTRTNHAKHHNDN
jgi:hypothetical protein